VVILKEKGFSVKEIAFVVQLSPRLVEEYLQLFDKYKANPEYKQRLDEITGKAHNFASFITEARSHNEQNKKKNVQDRL
jgi:predicted transcriptional regulator